MEEKNWGERLREAREFRGMTQRDLAKKVGVPWETISLVERGKRHTIRTSKLAQIAIALCISTDELVGVRKPRWEML